MLIAENVGFGESVLIEQTASISRTRPTPTLLANLAGGSSKSGGELVRPPIGQRLADNPAPVLLPQVYNALIFRQR